MSTRRRYFHRYKSCLEVIATDEQIDRDTARCVCDGKLEDLGWVFPHGGRLRRGEERCPCDARCTNAPGPRCECSCGGVNHGSGRVVIVNVDAGGVPRLTPSTPERCIARAAEYRDALGQIWAVHRAAKREREARNGRGPSRREHEILEDIGRIQKLRTHAGRLKAIAAWLAELAAA